MLLFLLLPLLDTFTHRILLASGGAWLSHSFLSDTMNAVVCTGKPPPSLPSARLSYNSDDRAATGSLAVPPRQRLRTSAKQIRALFSSVAQPPLPALRV